MWRISPEAFDLTSTVVSGSMTPAACAVTYLAFVAGPRMVRYLGQHAIKVITRLMGLG